MTKNYPPADPLRAPESGGHEPSQDQHANDRVEDDRRDDGGPDGADDGVLGGKDHDDGVAARAAEHAHVALAREDHGAADQPAGADAEGDVALGEDLADAQALGAGAFVHFAVAIAAGADVPA